MFTLKEILSQIKRVSILIRTDAIYPSDRTQIPNFAVDENSQIWTTLSH